VRIWLKLTLFRLGDSIESEGISSLADLLPFFFDRGSAGICFDLFVILLAIYLVYRTKEKNIHTYPNEDSIRVYAGLIGGRWLYTGLSALPLTAFRVYSSYSIVQWQSTDVVVMQQHSSVFACSRRANTDFVSTEAQHYVLWNVMDYVICLVWWPAPFFRISIL